MSDIETDSARTRDRSPSFPAIGIGKAVERTRMLFDKAKRHEARLVDAAVDWGFAPKSSSVLQTVAALLAYGLIESVGAAGGDARKIKVSETGWRILEDSRPGVREKLLSESAVRPKLIAQYAELWSNGRPQDQHAISQLKFESGLIAEAAIRFLKVFDENIGFTKQFVSDSVLDSNAETDVEKAAPTQAHPIRAVEQPRVSDLGNMAQMKVATMQDERELTTGLLSKSSSFRLIVSGRIGEKEIERLIRKLQLDKEILADQDDDDPRDPDLLNDAMREDKLLRKSQHE